MAWLTTAIFVVLICIAKPMITGTDWGGHEVDEDAYVFILVLWCVCMLYGLGAPTMMRWTHEMDLKIVKFPIERRMIDEKGNGVTIYKERR